MAKEILAVPEHCLGEVIRVIRTGLEVLGSCVSAETTENLNQWCDEEEEYLRGDGEEG